MNVEGSCVNRRSSERKQLDTYVGVEKLNSLSDCFLTFGELVCMRLIIRCKEENSSDVVR